MTRSVGVGVFRDDEILLVRHTDLARLPTGSYGFPAGRVEKSEELAAAAIRELYEETGLETKRKYLFKSYSRKNSIEMKEGYELFEFHPFLCIKYWGDLKASDKTVPEWVNMESLDDLLLVSDDIPALARRLHELKEKHFNYIIDF